MKHTQSGKYGVSRIAGAVLAGLMLVTANGATGAEKAAPADISVAVSGKDTKTNKYEEKPMNPTPTTPSQTITLDGPDWKIATDPDNKGRDEKWYDKTPDSNHDTLATGFVNPPAEAKPKIFWFWTNGNISKEGITADLEAMQRVGIGSVVIYQNLYGSQGSFVFDSPGWWEMIRHTVAECGRLGLEFGVHNCGGAQDPGGPWVTPEQSAQQITWSETHVSGPVKFRGSLKQPPFKEGFYKDISVYAYPLPAGVEFIADKPKNSLSGKAKITCSNQAADCKALVDGESSTFVGFKKPTPENPQYIQIEFEEPYTCRNASLLGERWQKNLEGYLQASDDGKIFRNIKKFKIRYQMEFVVTFPEVKARFYRFLFTFPGPIAEVNLGGEWRVDQWRGKAGFGFGYPVIRETITGRIPDEAAVKQNQLMNITDKMDKNGLLELEVPEGNWVILRVGHTSNGSRIWAGSEFSNGLVCDKMSSRSMSAHFNAHMGKMSKELGEQTGKTFRNIYSESIECVSPNWTSDYNHEFIKRCGYDPLPWLPTLTGQIVETEEQTDRFLWDFRRTIGDLIAENFYGLFKDMSNKLGREFIAQAPGPGEGKPLMVDAFQVKGKVSFPKGEFWVRSEEWGHYMDCKETSSSAHITGRKWAFAEAFTTTDDDLKRISYDPYGIKAIGDLHFCSGINQFVLDGWFCEPRKDKIPGMTIGWCGCMFNRNNFWWEQGAEWMKYLARCQYMLSQGSFVGDVVYYVGEDVPNSLLWDDIPVGYDYDGCGWDALSVMTVKDGRIALPSGISYKVLQLADRRLLTPKVVRKLKELVEAGAVVIGPKPLKSPSLQGYPACDAEVSKLADEVWGDCDGSSITQHSFGKGKVYWGKTLAEVLQEINLPPDFEFTSSLPDAKLKYIHRRTDDADIYFVSQPSHGG